MGDSERAKRRVAVRVVAGRRALRQQSTFAHIRSVSVVGYTSFAATRIARTWHRLLTNQAAAPLTPDPPAADSRSSLPQPHPPSVPASYPEGACEEDVTAMADDGGEGPRE
jgi:hypothetical protein